VWECSWHKIHQVHASVTQLVVHRKVSREMMPLQLHCGSRVPTHHEVGCISAAVDSDP
jgi:hypothetical protein